MATINFKTDGGLPVRHEIGKDDVQIVSVQACNGESFTGSIVFTFNGGVTGDIEPGDSLQIEGDPIVGTLAEKVTALREFLYPFFVSAPSDGGEPGEPVDGVVANRKTIVATSNQTVFASNPQFDLPTDINRVMVFSDGLLIPFSKSSNNVTIAARDAGAVVTIQIF